MALWNWSTTAANNANADPTINWAEGQAPSTVNDSARAMMAAVAALYQAPEWYYYGNTPTYVSSTQFTVAGNQTFTYSVGRRFRAILTSGPVYGTITASAYSSLTTVTVTLDSGNLDSSLSEVDVGLINPVEPSFPNGLSPSFNTIIVNNGVTCAGLRTNAAVTPSAIANNQGMYALWNASSGGGETSFVNNEGGGTGGFVFRNVNFANTIETGRVTFSGVGDITATGNVSGVNVSASGSVSAASMSATGNISASGSVVSTGPSYAGGLSGAYLATNGDLSGTLWGGSLSSWLSANKVSVGTNTYMHTDNNYAYNVVWDGVKVTFLINGTAVASVQGTAVSDRRAKKNIRSAEKRDSLGLIEQTRFRSFDFKKKYGGQHVPIGLIAQEAASDWVNEGELLSMNERVMLMDALHAIKQLSARVHALEDQLAQR